MADVKIQVEGLRELRARFRDAPGVFDRLMIKTLDFVLLILTGSVPRYPKPPTNSTYARTGTLGRTLGANMTGQSIGAKADIYTAQKVGGSGYRAEFGTRLGYAPHVIGERTQAKHMRHWWTMLTVARRASRKIQGAFVNMTERMAAYLDRGAK